MPLIAADSPVRKALAAIGVNADDIERHIEQQGAAKVVADLFDAFGIDRKSTADQIMAAAKDRLPELFDKIDLPVLWGRNEERFEKNRIIPGILCQIETELARFTRA